MAKNTTMNMDLDLPWHMIIDIVSHELGFAGRDIYDLIIEADSSTGHTSHDRDLAPDELMLEQT